MSFDALGKMSVGAAAGVVAERGGYVDHALSQLSDTIGVTAEAFGLPAIPDAGGLVASNAETFRFPTSAAEATDFVAAGLKAAREMLQQYLPDATYVPSEAQMPLPGGGSAAASRGADGEASRAASVATTGFFLAGAGAAAAVYTFGPETFKARVDKHYAVARRALHEVSVTLDRKLRESGAAARVEEARAAFGAAVGALEASASKFSLKTRANVSQALVAAAPVAADVEAALRRCSREVYEAVAPACLEIAAQVKPRVAAAAAAAAARAKQAWQTVEAAILAWESAVARALGKDESPR
jgi:hypothetical protein